MNSDLKRARNKRKRAKLRAKKRSTIVCPVMRIRFKTLILVSTCWTPTYRKHQFPSLTTVRRWENELGHNLRRYTESGWMYTTMCEANSSIVEYLVCLANTINSNDDLASMARVKCEIQYRGLSKRRCVWQGHAMAAEAARMVAEVCSFMRQTYSEELDSQEPTQFLSSKEI